ncbi:MAG: sensor histidine kinase [Pontibacterium sp.]
MGIVYRLRKQHRKAQQQQQSTIDQLRVNQQQLVQTNAHQQAFLDKLAHEYRTPLAIIQNACLILEEKLEGRVIEAFTSFDMIDNAIQRLTRLVESASKETATAGTAPHCDIKQSLTDAIGAMRIIHDAPIQLIDQLPAQAYISLDTEVALTCIDNILGNAAKYGAGKPVKVSTQLDQDWISVHVQDQGFGIPAEDLPHLFDRQFRGANADKAQGDGLGLHIVKRQLNQCGGQIHVESNVGQGTLVTLRFPAYIPQQPSINDTVTTTEEHA